MLLSAIALFLFVPLSATWAVWEGNAGIAASSEFPGSGMFARSDMFPKNTIVEIQNLETDITVRAIITGSAGMPGLVAVLSPETASALNIASGSVCRVRISIPSPVAERSAEGTSVFPTGTESRDPDVNPGVAANTAKTVNLESFGEDSSDQLVPLSSSAVAQAPAAAVPAAAPIVAAPVVAPVTETPAAETPPVTEAPVAQVPPEATPEVTPEPTVAEVAPEPTVEPAAAEVAPEPAVTEPTVAEVAPEPTVEPAVAQVAPEPTVEPAVAEVAPEPTPEATAETAPAIPEENVAPSIAAEPATPEEAVTVTAGEAAPIAAESASGVSYEEPEVTMVPETAEIAEAPAPSASEVTLVPTDANPPEPVAAEPESPAIADVPVAEPIAPPVSVAEPAIVVTVEPVAPAVEAPVAESEPEPAIAEPAPAIAATVTAPIVVAPVELPSTAPAKKGQIYIQIASYSDSANVKKVIDAYGKKYPYVLEKSVAKKGEVTKILIGPVGKDEYGAVLERFKKLGFKDAFVKKVN